MVWYLKLDRPQVQSSSSSRFSSFSTVASSGPKVHSHLRTLAGDPLLQRVESTTVLSHPLSSSAVSPSSSASARSSAPEEKFRTSRSRGSPRLSGSIHVLLSRLASVVTVLRHRLDAAAIRYPPVWCLHQVGHTHGRQRQGRQFGRLCRMDLHGSEVESSRVPSCLSGSRHQVRSTFSPRPLPDSAYCRDLGGFQSLERLRRNSTF